MKQGLSIYDTSCGTEYRYDDANSILVEGRNEINVVLRALRQSKDPEAEKLSKKLWQLHTGFYRCEQCHTLSRKFPKKYVRICDSCMHPPGFWERVSYENQERLKAEAKKKWDSLLEEYEIEK